MHISTLSDKNRTKTRIAVYLIGINNNQVLLGHRINVSYMNNHWSLPAGHVFEYESIFAAMIREAYEECGIRITKNDLEIIGTEHQFSPPYDYVNYFFKIDLSAFHVINTEPEKCSELKFFDYHNLPQPIDPYSQQVIHKAIFSPSSWIDENGF